MQTAIGMRYLGLVLLGTITISGCGKRGPLVYPDMLVPEAPQSVQLEQQGSSLQLSFNLPARDRRGRGLKEPFVVQVQRRELQPDEQAACGSCAKDYHTARLIDPAFPAPAMKFGNRMVLLDSEVSQGKRYQYRIAAISTDGAESGALAETATARVCSVPLPPVITAQAVHGGMIVLQLQGELPENAELVGFAIYRASGDEALPPLPLVTTLGATRYEDQTVQQGVSYRYAARTVVRRGDDLLMSSELSAVVVSSPAD